MLRTVVAVLVGFAVWSVAWLGGNAGLKAAIPSAYESSDVPTKAGVLVAVLVLSVACSVAAGIIAARLKGSAAAATVVALGIVLLAVGVPIQWSAWDKMPVWYHLSFLALLIPATVAGGALISRKPA